MPSLVNSFTSRDFSNIYEWLISILREECPEITTDLNASDAGISLIRLFARVSDSLSLYIDEAFAESFISSAKFKQSLIDIARTVDLLPKMANAATTSVTITRKVNYGNVEGTNTIIIPQWTPVTKDDGIQYLLTEEVVLLSTDIFKEVNIIQGERIQQTITLSDFSSSLSTGRYFYNIGANVASGTVYFVENSLISWEEVESFWRSFSSDNHFVCEVYADLVNGVSDTIYFTTGNGIQGNDLTSGSSYLLTYIRCNGAEGNTGAGLIRNISGYDTYVTVTNSIGASGGAGVENIEEFRLRIPKVVRTQRRAVTKEDYEALVLSIPGVKRCECIDRNNVDLWPHLYVIIYVVPEGGGVMSTQLKESIISELTSIGALGGWSGRYVLLDAETIPINITCTVGVDYGYQSNVVISSVTAAINSYFYVDNNDIHKVFSLGELHTEIMAVAGVSWVEFNDLVVNVYPGYGQLCILGTLSISVGT